MFTWWQNINCFKQFPKGHYAIDKKGLDRDPDFISLKIEHPSSTLGARQLEHLIRNLLTVKFTINLYNYFHEIKFFVTFERGLLERRY